MPKKHKPNRLIDEKSPYLLQHAYNPVNWYPWGEEAFAKAKQENKPVFLSIGYSTCHWCHVMERESFQDEEVAQLLNDHYVCIKVDREERPDIDHVYMMVCQTLTGQGGWPLTVFLTPDKMPFYAGTYFPKFSQQGRVGMMDLLTQIHVQWLDDAEKITHSGARLAEKIREHMSESTSGDFSMELVNQAFEQFDQSFDEWNGGFGTAPKFPAAHQLTFLLRYARTFNNERALHLVDKTLQMMYRGGIYDHIGYGFVRYSTDESWRIPHFEKMLCENALLAMAYTEAYQHTRNPLYRKVAEQILTYAEREMLSPEGVFYSAEDAETEGVEGKFYVWLPGEVESILGVEDGEWMCDLLDITLEGNFEGSSVPNLLSDFSFEQLSNPQQAERFSRCIEKLYEAREERVKPFKDDKVLTSWNGLMIAALAKAGAAFQDTSYTDMASKAFQWILDNMKDNQGYLLARYRKGEAAIEAFLDDYAFLAWGAIELFETTQQPEYLRVALHLHEQMHDLFWDQDRGGYQFTSEHGEQLFMTIKDVHDGSVPSGNSVAAYNTVRLARWTGDLEMRKLAEQQLRSFAKQVAKFPMGYAMFMQAMELWFSISAEWVIAGSKEDPLVGRAVASFQQAFTPHEFMVVHDPSEKGNELRELLPQIAGKGMKEADGTSIPQFYICENYTCHAPFTEIESWEAKLENNIQKS